MDKIDVIVVGAGPAGICAGMAIAKGGKKVVVIERAKNAGTKNMFGGEFYMNPTKELFPDLLESAPIERFTVSHKWIILSGDKSTTIDYSDYSGEYNSFTTFRPKFDAWCVEQAKKSGVYFAFETVVESLIVKNNKIVGVTTEREEYFADLVILADGVNSLLAKQIGLQKPTLPENVALSVKEVYKLPKELINERFNVKDNEAHCYQMISGPLAGMFGMGFMYLNKESVSIGLGVSLQALKDKKVRIYELLDEMKNNKLISRFIEDGELVEYSAHLIPEGGYKNIESLYGNGVLVVGDAAGLVNNLHFEGTNLAMISGKLAGETALEAIEKQDFSKKTLSSYRKKLDESFVMQDLKTYKNVVGDIEKNSKIFLGFYPDKICEFFEIFIHTDGTPRKQKYRKYMFEFFKQRGFFGALKDGLIALKLMIEAIL